MLNKMHIVQLALIICFKFSPILSVNTKFPEDFLFGVSTSAYQIEGGRDSRGETAYDYHQRLNPSLVKDFSNATIACDSYNLYNEDISILEDLRVDFYRFSISWSRILPKGHPNQINPDGIRYYNRLIDGLLAKKIQPMVTISHSDLPKTLQDLGGWVNPILSDIFEDYSRILFENFGDRVKYWVTINENLYGFGNDQEPPCLNQSGIGEYLAIKTLVLAHAKVFHLYDKKFRKEQKGKIGFVLDAFWYESGSDSVEDLEATERVREFKIGTIANPILGTGDFPKIVKQRVKEMSLKEGFFRSRFPQLTPEEVKYIKGSFDFVGLNMYSTFMVKNDPEIKNLESYSHPKDMGAKFYQDPKWASSASPWLKVVPWGMRHVLKWFKQKYNNPTIFITENGFSDKGKLEDLDRINFLKSYLKELLDAIYDDGVQVKGYFVWSLMDNFEWTAGYTERFGLYHVDFEDPGRKRTPKSSAKWFKNLIQKRELDPLVSNGLKIEL